MVYSWNVVGFFCPGEQRGLVAKYALEQGEAGGSLLEGILCILGPGEETVPVVLLVMTIGPEISPNLLYLPFSLSISLGMISGGKGVQRHRGT